MCFTVTSVIDGNTFEVSPNWNWNDRTGSIVRANGYDAPALGEPGYQAAKNKMAELVLNGQVKLTKMLGFSSDRLLCDVEYNSLNLADYFYEYRTD